MFLLKTSLFSPPEYVLETVVLFFKTRGTEAVNGLFKDA